MSPSLFLGDAVRAHAQRRRTRRALAWGVLLGLAAGFALALWLIEPSPRSVLVGYGCEPTDGLMVAIEEDEFPGQCAAIVPVRVEPRP